MGSVLVTGAGGQDGGYLCERLVAEGHDVHAVVRARGGSPLPSWLAGVHPHDVDVRDGDALSRLVADVEPDEVYNLAAISSVAQSWSDPVLTSQVNAIAVVSLLAAALEVQERLGRRVAVVQASSAEMFGVSRDRPQHEGTHLAPVNPYGVAKAFAHSMVSVYRSRDLHAASCVLYNHESPRRPETFVARKITRAAARIARGDATELVLGSMDVQRDWGWAPDYVDALVRAARCEVAQDFVIATGVPRTIEDFVAAAFAAVGVEDWRPLVRTDPSFSRPREAAVLFGDASRARDVLGWRTTVSFPEMVQRMVDVDREADAPW